MVSKLLHVFFLNWAFSLFDIVSNEEMGILCGHEGTISRLMIQDEHMISAAEDGTIRY